VKGYEFHPEAEIDLDAIWEFTAEDNHRAADRMIDQIESTIEALVPFPAQGHRRPDLTSRPLRIILGARISGCLHARRKAVVDRRDHAWTRSPRVMAAILRGRE